MPMTDLAMIDENMLRQIELLDQQHVLQFWNELNTVEQANLTEQLSHVDWNLIEEYRSLLSNQCVPSTNEIGKVSPPKDFVRRPKTEAEATLWNRAREIGEQALQAGKVAAVLLAGGQGTRLDFALPKGMYPIGAVSGKSLFEILAQQVVALTERFRQSIPSHLRSDT